MKRTLATLGVVGLGLISLTAPAMAASDMVTVCHNDGGTWSPLEFNVNGIGGHAQHGLDIIPPTPKAPAGLNWNNTGKLTYIANCAALPPGETVEQPPVEVPPVEVPPVVVPPIVVTPPVEPVVVPPVVVEQPVENVVEPPATVVEPITEVSTVVEQPAVVAPAAGAVAAPAQPAAAAQPAARTGTPVTTSLGTNQGYNAQTAVGGAEGSPAWLGGLGALAAAGAAVAMRRRSGATN